MEITALQPSPPEQLHARIFRRSVGWWVAARLASRTNFYGPFPHAETALVVKQKVERYVSVNDDLPGYMDDEPAMDSPYGRPDK